MSRANLRRTINALSAPRDTARDHVTRALATLMCTLQQSETIAGADRSDVRVAVHRLWLALREIDRKDGRAAKSHPTHDDRAARSA